MLIDSFFHAATNTWSHVAAAGDGASAAIVDPVLDFDPVSGRVSAESAAAILACVHAHGLKVDWILETHAHADHLSAADSADTRPETGSKSSTGSTIAALAPSPAAATCDHVFVAA